MTETEVLEPTSGVEETPTATETPAAPEGVAPSAPVVETAITEPAASLSTRPRGPDGRFIKADGTQASEAEHAAMEAAPPTSPPPAATPPPPAPTPGEPFVFRADGQKIQVPGAAVSTDGTLTIPADQVPTIRQLLAEGVSHRGSWRKEKAESDRQLAEAHAAVDAVKEKYSEVGTLMYRILFDDPAALQALIDSPDRRELLQDRLALMWERSDLKAPKATKAPDADAGQQNQQLEQAARQTLAEYVDELLETPQARAIYATEKDREEVKARYVRRLAAYFVDQDGELALHENAVDADFQDELKLRQAGRQAGADAADG